jgi:hypothetical protein
MLFAPALARAQTLNYKLASVFVYNFTKYVEWPANSKGGLFIIGVYGDSPMTVELNKFITSKHVGEQTIIVKVVSSVQEAGECNILFVPLTQSGKIKEISQAIKGKPTLTVTEKSGLIMKGACISIFLDEDDDYKTKFEVNKTTIADNGLQVALDLLQLAARAVK